MKEVLLFDALVVGEQRNSHGLCDVPANLGRTLAVAADFSHTCAIGNSGRMGTPMGPKHPLKGPKYPNMEYIWLLLGIVIMFWGICLIFGYLDP